MIPFTSNIPVTFTINDTCTVLVAMAGTTPSNSAGYLLTINKNKLERGSESVEFTAIDTH